MSGFGAEMMPIMPGTQAGTEQIKPQTQKSEGGASEFAKLFEQRLSSEQEATGRMIESFGLSQDQQLVQKALPADPMNVPAIEMGSVNPSLESRNIVTNVLDRINLGMHKMESIIETAATGGPSGSGLSRGGTAGLNGFGSGQFTPAELISLQAGVYQIALETELTSKTFEMANNSTRTVWNTNFQ